MNVDERYIQYNWVLLDAIGISYDEAADSDTGTGFSFMTAACILVGVLVLLAAGLVIYNILKISITKRIKEYGTLRAIGGERGQIYRLVSLQLLILCGAGIPIGLLLGILSAKGVLIAATGLLNPDLFMANSTSELNSAINTAQYGKTTDALCQYRSHTSVCSAGCLSCCPVRIPCISYCCYVGADCENQTQDKKEPQHP